MNANLPSKAQTLRCAVYTRKSSDEGLEQSFNSLHAQREACEAYVKSQAHEGWTCLPTAYDDGGFSGGSMERPGLRALLEDIGRGRIDVVVVYKVDRLTRSLTDFAKIVQAFDDRGVSFVSVTQAFNTTTSMGRLTLNVLLSFAQFEREVTGERIRDKIAASKAKGMWMGGVLPLGYDRNGRTLKINEAEAAVVRMIFQRYLAIGSVRDLKEALEDEGVLSKVWTTSKGDVRGGIPFNRGGLYHLLQSRLYIGEIPHRDKHYPGLHPGIIDPDLFDTVQRKLADGRFKHRQSKTRAADALLVGRLFDAVGEPMSPTFAYGRGGKGYRYYIAMALQRGERSASDGDRIERVSAEVLETFVREQVCRLAGSPVADDDAVLDLVRRVELRTEATHFVLNVAVLFGADHPDIALEDLQARLSPDERVLIDQDRSVMRIVLPVRMQMRGGRTFLQTEEDPGALRPRFNAGLIEALKSAHIELAALSASPLTPAAELRQARAPNSAHRRQASKLAFLAPDLQREILDGRQPRRLTLRELLRVELPLDWEDQRQWFAAMDAPRKSA